MEFITNLQNSVDESKPSLFELLSEEKLSSLIPPSLRYVLAAATRRYPRYLLPVFNSFDEVYACLALLVERHFLLTYGGGFTENFYGLKRERVLRVKGGELPRAELGASKIVRETLKLHERDVWKNLAVMVGLPYLKRKLDESYDVHISQPAVLGRRYQRDSLPPRPTIRQRILQYYKWFLRNVYPSVHAAYYFSLLAFQLLYLFDASKFHSPFLWMIGVRTRRLGAADFRAIEEAETARTKPRPTPATTRPGQATSLFAPHIFNNVVYPRLLSSLRLLLPASIFALKFLEWWHASDFARKLSKKANEGLDLPPPIIAGLTTSSKLVTASKDAKESSRPVSSSSEKPTISDSTLLNPPSSPRQPPISASTHLPILTVPPISFPSSSSSCPICLTQIVTPTACQTGYVFCYTCIFRWIDGSHDRQKAFMEGGRGVEGWAEEEGSREGKWESGKGRCAVTGRRVLGGTDGLRRVMV
ncbi:MAG: hypothetical protein M1823_004230 [Watsoniomyces obsoletus]|nr:MAG: hypothetical protein M1823_004230 [Watsoniomyces obsoletus]